MSPSTREPVSPVDTAWLRMDSDTNLMMIGTVMIYDRPINPDSLREIVETKLLHYVRFKQKVVYDGDKVYWEKDPHFHIDNHIHQLGLPGDKGKQELQKLASDLNSTPLDFNHPLWQMHLVEYQDGCALITRIHHCIADGIALVRVMLNMTDDISAPKPQSEITDTNTSPIDKWIKPVESLIKHTFELGHDLYEEGKDLVEHPQHLLDIAKEGIEIGTELTRIGLMPDDPDTCLKQEQSGRKNVAWAPQLSLKGVKSTAHALGGTINDVLLAAAAGSLRSYLLAQNKNETLDDIHAAIPFNLRPLDQPIKSLGNEFGLVVVDMPISEESAYERFLYVQKYMQELKKSHQPQVFYGMLSALGKGPSVLEQTALEILSKKASLVMTNVPGPREPLFLAGAKLLHPMVWVPQSGEVGLGLSILSYDGSVLFGVVADDQIVPNPQALVDGFLTSYEELAAMTNTAEELEVQ